jgi:hypothetical protein
MKKVFLAFVMALISIVSYALGYGKYSLPHTASEAELQKYVGQHVKLFPCEGIRTYSFIKEEKGHDEVVFRQEFKGVIGQVYTIKKVKVVKQIILELEDVNGKSVKAKVNIDHAYDYKGMQTCESFFLVDKFENDKKELIGKSINNFEGKPVAKIVDFVMLTVTLEYPIPRLMVQSDFDGTKVLCTMEEAEKICSNFGKIITSPKVVTQYRVIGVIGTEKYAFKGGAATYVLEDTSNPSKKKTGTIINPESTIFKEELSGRYISVLSKVEKPSNPAIRYGKTTTVNDENVSRYSYVDNVIDILIFGGSTQFDFVLKNVSDNSIKVIWNEAVFVSYDGTTSKVIHAGTRYSLREADQPATTIIKGAKIEDIAAPNCNIRYSEILKEWVKDSMYPTTPATEPGQLRLMLPIQIKEVINEYVFVFDVKYVYNHPDVLTFLK